MAGVHAYVPHSGTSVFRAAQLGRVATTLQYIDLSEDFFTIPGRTYQLKMWSMRLSGQCSLTASLQGMPGTPFRYDEFLLVGTSAPLNTWLEYTGYATVPLSTGTGSRFVIRLGCLGLGLQEIVVDDIAIRMMSL